MLGLGARSSFRRMDLPIPFDGSQKAIPPVHGGGVADEIIGAGQIRQAVAKMRHVSAVANLSILGHDVAEPQGR